MGFFQVLWAQQAGCATSPPEAPKAARSCAAGGATTPCASNVSPSVSVSSSGVVLWSAATARTSWTFTPANLTSEPIGWTWPNSDATSIPVASDSFSRLLMTVGPAYKSFIISLAFNPSWGDFGDTGMEKRWLVEKRDAKKQNKTELTLEVRHTKV